MRTELKRMIEAHRRVLDHLATGVAIFNVDRKLIFHNTAFRSLFELDPAFLEHTPTDSAVLDTLRTSRQVPEEQDFRQWKQQLYEAYRAVEPKEQMWHLPDGRTLRVVTAPNPEGGVTYLYDDVTERLDMHRRYDALIKVQSETLDHLAEAVAVFGSDGRVRLHNPAFQRMWKLSRRVARPAPAYRGGDSLGAGHARRQQCVAKPAYRGHRDRRASADRRAHRTARRHDDRHDHHAAARRRHAWSRSRMSATRSTSSARCARKTRRWRPPTPSRSISCTTCLTNCVHRSPTSSGLPICSATPLLVPSRKSSTNISATSPPRPMRCSRSSITSSTSPPSMPEPCRSIWAMSTYTPACRKPPKACRTA